MSSLEGVNRNRSLIFLSLQQPFFLIPNQNVPCCKLSLLPLVLLLCPLENNLAHCLLNPQSPFRWSQTAVKSLLKHIFSKLNKPSFRHLCCAPGSSLPQWPYAGFCPLSQCLFYSSPDAGVFQLAISFIFSSNFVSVLAVAWVHKGFTR